MSAGEAAPSGSAFDPAEFVRDLTTRPGVYRMIGADGEIIYVGKARNLKARVGSYFSGKDASIKTRAMVEQVRDIQVIVTRTEGEALILENNLIKQHQPRYNVLLRDDKSYPYVFLSTAQTFPRLEFHRGAQKEKGRYFGPFPNAAAVRESLQLMQKVFPIRQCEDSYFRNRTRPCLQYQIKRCTAPCVGFISQEQYGEDVKHAALFLEGHSKEVIDELVSSMESAAARMDYELAARYRDQIKTLRHILEKQYISGAQGDFDVVVCAAGAGLACVQVFFIRDGRNLGNKTFYPRHTENLDVADIIAAFLPQYYLDRAIPPEIVVPCDVPESDILVRALSESAGRDVHLTHGVRGARARMVEMAQANAETSLAHYQVSRGETREKLLALQSLFGLGDLPARMECFDISHTQGAQTVASCVVFVDGKPAKQEYRRFNIENIQPGDDYAAMEQALKRRYMRLRNGEGVMPDILFIDGGKGQVRAAQRALAEAEVSGLFMVGVAKGEGRKPGLETLYVATDDSSHSLESDAPALHLIQHIRDEAHRFAITGHRRRREAGSGESPLNGIAGLGPKRRRALLTHFGGLQGLRRAGVEELAKVPGISVPLAQRIYASLQLQK